MNTCRSLVVLLVLAGCGGGGESVDGGSQTDAQSDAQGDAMGGPVTTLPVGVWTELTPVAADRAHWTGAGCGVQSTCSYGVWTIVVDPNNAAIVYVTIDQLGLWRSRDAGATWSRLGDPDADQDPFDSETTYLDSPLGLAIDPSDSMHLYATQGVRGQKLGFWISNDGGETWRRPKSSGQLGNDLTAMAVDPTDFDHILISSHADWSSTTEYASGILESTDGGETWTPHIPPGEPWSAGTKGVHFLHDPDSQQGDANTWLVVDESAGFWRTNNGGDTWTKVAGRHGPHGGHGIYYTAAGVLYAGAIPGVVRSTNNGVSWTDVDVPDGAYYAVGGDGEHLYVHVVDYDTARPYATASETNGNAWTTAGPSIPGYPTSYTYDPVNRVLYSANERGGLWALRVAE